MTTKEQIIRRKELWMKVLVTCVVLVLAIPLVATWVNAIIPYPFPPDIGGALVVTALVLAVTAGIAGGMRSELDYQLRNRRDL